MALIFDEVVKLFSSREKSNVFDYDATGLSVYGKTYEFSRKGYVTRSGVRGYILSAGYAHDFILANFLDPGNTNHGSLFGIVSMLQLIYLALIILASLEQMVSRELALIFKN